MKKKLSLFVLVFILFFSLTGSVIANTDLASPNLWETADYTIYADSVRASMAGITYGPDNLKGYDTSSAWVEGAPGYGYGQGLTIYPNRPLYLHGFAFSNGYNKSSKSRNENGSIYSFDFYINNQFIDTIYLSNTSYWQYYVHPVGFNLTPQDEIRLVITDVYVGTLDDEQDTALSALLLLYDDYKQPQPAPPPQTIATDPPTDVQQTDTETAAENKVKPETTESKNTKKEAATIEVRSLITVVAVIVALLAVGFAVIVLLRSKNTKNQKDKDDPFQT